MIAEKSFCRNTQTENAFICEQHYEALARMEFGIAHNGVILLSGEPGVGKSTVIRLLADKLEPSKHCVCYINNSELTPKNLYCEILCALSVSPFNHLPKIKKQFQEVAVSVSRNHGKKIVVFIDNAQSLPTPTIHEIRYLINFEMDATSPIAVLLVGQPEIFATLRLRVFEPLFYRINSHYQFKGLNQKQTKAYITHQLKLSAVNLLFPDDVVTRIWSHSRGLPQIINTICIHCLIDMEANSLELVDNGVLDRVLSDLQY